MKREKKGEEGNKQEENAKDGKSQERRTRL